MSAGGLVPAAEGDNDAAEADFDRAFQLSELGRYREAAALALRGLAAHPDSVHGLTILAFVQSRLDDHDAARATSERALVIDPESAWANYTRGIVLWSDGDAESAVACFDRAIELWPESAYMHAIKAELLDALDRPGEGLAEIDVALAMDPENVSFRVEKIDLLRALERHGAADKVVRAALRLAPDSLAVHRRVADAALRQDRPAVAERWFRTALAADPNDEWTRESLAEAIRQRARQRAALPDAWCVGLIMAIWMSGAKLVEAGLMNFSGLPVLVILSFSGMRIAQDWLVFRHDLARVVVPSSEWFLRGATVVTAVVAALLTLAQLTPFGADLCPVMYGVIVTLFMIVVVRFALSPGVREVQLRQGSGGVRELVGKASHSAAAVLGWFDGGKRQ